MEARCRRAYPLFQCCHQREEMVIFLVHVRWVLASITTIGVRIEPQAKLGRLVAELRVRISGNSISFSLRKCVQPRQLLLVVVVASGLQMVHQICR